MNTQELIDMLARGAGPAPRALVARRLSPAVAAGGVLSVALAVVAFGSIPPAMFSTPAPWLKLAYAGSLALAAVWLTARLSRPSASSRPAWVATLAVVGAMLAAGAATLVSMPVSDWPAALLGESWLACPWRVLLLGLPALAAALWALRGLAPTRPRAAGCAAGLLAGSLGAAGYALACTEASSAFVAVWYTLGIGLTGAIGAALGPRVLRW